MPRADSEWVQALARREPSALAELRGVLRDGLRRGLSKQQVADAQLDDFAQEALLRVSSALAGFRGTSAFTTWALSIALRTAFDELRRARWKDVSLESLSADPARAAQLDRAEEPRHDQSLQRRRVLAMLSEAMEQTLTPRQREALEAVVRLEEAGMPFGEVAARLGTNRNALYKLTHDARCRLRQALLDRGVTADDVSWALE